MDSRLCNLSLACFDLSPAGPYNGRMRTWSIPAEGPLSLRLAADARLTTPSYVDDHIWEVILAGGEPPALAIETTYGLRAARMRLFPAFGWEGESVSDPDDFVIRPVVRRFFPNYLQIDMRPFGDLEVEAAYWVADSHSLVGRFMLRNLRSVESRVRLALHAALLPGENPQPMGEAAFGGAVVMSGRTGNLAPVIFVSGGAVFDRLRYPALVIEHLLPAGSTKTVVWAQAALANPQAGFEAVRTLASRPWEAEVARIEAANAGQVEIETGEADWDAAFAFAQKVALGAFVGPTRHLPHAALVSTRLPDQGYSARGDGRDYAGPWEGQSVGDAYLAVPLVLPVAPALAQGVVRNYLHAQSPGGFIDARPGLAGQRSGTICPPLLGTLAWRIYEQTEDRQFLADCLPRLVDFVEAWLGPEHDADQDGHPEWDHTVHAGFDDWPSFVRWHPWGQGLELSKAETPDLAAYLVRDCQALVRAAEVLGRSEVAERLTAVVDRLRVSVERSWREPTSSYHHQDRDGHQVTPGSYIGKGRGHFVLDVGRVFDPPARVLVRVQGPEAKAQRAAVAITGRGGRGRNRVDRVGRGAFQWYWDLGTATSERTYTAIERIEVSGLNDEFTMEVRSADYSRQDLSLLLPLWAGIPDEDRADRLIRRTLTDPERFWRPYGLSLCSARDPAFAPDGQSGSGGVSMLWNTMLGEGLVNYGHMDRAVDLLHRLMAAVVHSLKTDKAFREKYNSDTLAGLGERDPICGLAPVTLFLHVLGVRLIHPHKVQVARRNPFSWPVTIRWLGLSVYLEPGGPITVTFPDGQSMQVSGDKPQEIEQLH